MRAVLNAYAREPELPPRYDAGAWYAPFRSAITARIAPGNSVLDIGAGRKPTLLPEERPADVHYVGLDTSAVELASAPSGSYDELVIAPAERRVAECEDRFDLAISFMVFEHVERLDVALANIHSYLRPGGRLVAQLAGGLSPFAIASRAIPHRLTRSILGRIQGRAPESVFPAHYDHCSHTGLTRLLDGVWSDWRIEPLFVGYGYLNFSRIMRALYMGYEEWAYIGDRKNLAVHYRIVAEA